VSSGRFLKILAAALIAVGAALLAAHWRQAAPEAPGGLLVPQLDAQLAAVTVVEIRHGAARPAVTLHRQADRWTVAERGDYPADTERLRRLLLALAEAHVIEEKTSDPANYHALGVDDVQIAITTPASTLTLFLGKLTAGGSFVRRANEARSLLVAPGLSAESDARDWIDARLLDVRRDQVRQIDVKPVTGAPFKRKDSDFGALASLNALDVAPAGDVDLHPAATATVTLADGAVLSLSGAAVQDKHWLTLSSSTDSALNDRTRGRVFEIGASRYDSLFKP
jgi:hypothetical protein